MLRKKGRLFFVKVHYCSNCELYNNGVREDDIILCEMMTYSSNNPLVKLDLEEGEFLCHSDDESDEAFLVYEGRPDGVGFICNRSKARAKELLGGEWYAN